ncbi:MULTISPECIES: hypothetical protein [unclassified Pseudomonas]|uniref:hypothetical protein n=1 Tax=unclassified Pseudomonas TaxID=196821 RepID=UPI001FFFB225|nr:hypothetical protein [Pseudomonas sp. MWU12-2020]
MRAEVADINNDGSSELYVFYPLARARHAGRTDRLLSQQQEISERNLPASRQRQPENPKTAEGYQGEDSFAVMENSLVQHFPVYDSADAGAGRTGKMRQVQYTLVASEAAWILREDKVTEF